MNKFAIATISLLLISGLCRVASASDDLSISSCSEAQIRTKFLNGEEASCITSAGIIFVSNKDGITDTGPGGKTWDRKLKIGVNFDEATKFCKENGMTLPSGYLSQKAQLDEFYSQEMKDTLFQLNGSKESDISIAQSHHFTEVFPDINQYLVWSSSRHPLYDDAVGALTSGKIGYYAWFYNSMNAGVPGAARCVR